MATLGYLYKIVEDKRIKDAEKAERSKCKPHTQLIECKSGKTKKIRHK